MIAAGNAGGLVAGGASAPSAAAPAEVRVLRAFLWEGEVRQAGDVLTLADARDARMLVTWGKAEILPPAPPAEAPPAEPPAATPAPRAARAAKEPKT
jgi:hypothetical protein